MNSPDSWIDLQEIARLVRQILPDDDDSDDRDENGPPSRGTSVPTGAAADAPVSLFADPPQVSTSSPPSNGDPRNDEDESDFFPELDDLPLPADPDTLLTQDIPLPELRSRAEDALRAIHALADRNEEPRPLPDTTPVPTPVPTPIPAVATATDHDEPIDYRFHMPEGRLRDRLQAYADWVQRVTGCKRLMISDAQGYSLLQEAGESPDPTIVGSALQLLEALEQVRNRMDAAEARSGVYIPLGEEEWFGVLECDSSIGHVCISMVTQAPLAKGAAEELIRTLQATLDA